MEFKRVTRVAVFVDYDNFTINYNKYYKVEVDDNLWEKLNDELMHYYRTHFIRNDYEVLEHCGTWLCVGLSDYPIGEEKRNKERIYRPIDRRFGYIVNYGTRKVKTNAKTGKQELGEEKGVDSEIICQMLMGAFLNHYDVCILLSDDADYIPAVRRVQEFFGRRVIQAGFDGEKLRESAYAHIPFENGMNLKKLSMRLFADVLFEHGKSELDKTAVSQLGFIIKKLNWDRSLKLVIHGHTANTGRDIDRLALSEERAKAVADHIISKGIEAGRVSWQGHGGTMPVATNNNEEGRKRNRRVEFVLTH